MVTADLILEENELYSLDMKTGNIQVDKDIFDDFQKDTYLKISFVDSNDDTPMLYKMISETDDYIEMEYIGEAQEED